MRFKTTVRATNSTALPATPKRTCRGAVLSSLLAACLALCLSSEAEAQIPPFQERDANWDTVSTVAMAIGVASVSLTPRVYYASPDATVGWKARWHISALAPILTMTSLTLLMNGPIRDEIQSPKQGCTLDQTLANLPGSGCESFGGPSTHSFAAWGALGAGTGIFLMDTIKYSNGRFNVPSFLGNVVVPLSAAVMTSAARSANGNGLGPEGTEQVVMGMLPGLGLGLLSGLGYAAFQEPDCGYGGYLFCW